MKVYWIEVSYLRNDNKKGVVYIFVKANDALQAYELADEALCLKGLKPYKWDFVEPYQIYLEWETVEQTDHFRELYEKAKKTKQCVFDRFYLLSEL